MISGALFLNPKRDVTINNIWGKNIKKLAIVYLVWSFLYALYFFDGRPLNLVTWFIQGPYHMWFIPMIICLYIITPLLRRITTDQKTTKYFLIVSFVFTFLLSDFGLILKGIDSFHFVDDSLFDFYSALFENCHYFFTLGYVPYYVIGYFLHETEINLRQRKIIYCLGIIGFICSVGLTMVFPIITGVETTIFYEYNTTFVFFETIALFVFVKNLMKTKHCRKKVLLISENSFGVYLIHIFVIKILSSIGFNNDLFTPVLMVPTTVLTTLLISFGIVWLLRKNRIVSKYFI